jgi:5-methylcytosine-specific restriction enzyme B
MSAFTWIPFYKELAGKLLEYRDRQGELIALLKKAEDQGLPVISLSDKTAKNKTTPLAAIDPFTFFAAFNRKAKPENRQALLAIIKDRLQVQAPVPADFDGIPIMDPRMSRFIPWRYEQQVDDVASLWALTEAVVVGPPQSLSPDLFDRCLRIKCVSVTNLTMGLYWMRPETYLALDRRNRALLDKRGVAHKVSGWVSYLDFMEKARLKVPETPFKFSLVAYEGEQEGRTAMRFWKISHGKADFSSANRQDYLQEHTIHVHKNTKKGQGAQFERTMKEIDLFYLCHGNDDGVRVFGRIRGPAAPSPHGDGWRQRPYEVVFEGLKPEQKYSGLKKGWTPNYNSTCMEVPEKELKAFESNILKPFFGKNLTDIPEFGSGAGNAEASPSTNIILYGPPGTGKTYISLQQAVERATGLRIADLAQARRQLAELRGKGRIEFVTFHQSYSYEDFVEGIRPTLDGDGAAIRYECSDGIFKTLALRALYDCLEPCEAATTGEFDARWQALVAQIGAEPEREYDSISGSSTYQLTLSSRGNVTATNTKTPDMSQLTFSRINLMKIFAAHGSKARISTTDIQETLGVGSHSSLGAVLFRELKNVQPAQGMTKQPILASDEERCDAALAFLNEKESSQYRLRSSGPVAHYVLVVDEINRGNISKIFGELITLIESDKRVGAANEMRVMLPYSKKLFGVPGNLHLIGTMNTADKSIALVDVALRRRFEFEEFMPRYDLVPEVVRDVLIEMNRRIALRKDRDHQIGHACFMGEMEVNAVFKG